MILRLVICMLALGVAANADNTGIHGVADQHATFNPAAISPELGRQAGDVPRAPPFLPGPPKLHHEPARSGGGGGGGGGPATVLATNADFSPPASASFLALSDNNTTIPPDTHGSVGSNFVMTALNSEIRYQDRTGGVINTFSLQSFWSPLGNPSPFDPKTGYDSRGGRWILADMANETATNSSILVAVSADSSPTGTWYQYRIDADSNDLYWADYTSLGFNKDWIVVHANMFDFSNNFKQAQIYVFDKTNLYANGAGNYTMFVDPDSFGQEPAETYDATEPRMYFLEEWDISAGMLRMSEIRGTVGSEIYTNGTSFPQDSSTAWNFQAPGGGNLGPQLGTTLAVELNDSRMQHLVMRNGKLWGTHVVFLPATGTITHASVQWWQIATNGTVLQRGRIDDTNGIQCFAFPSVAVNQNDDALLGFGIFVPRATPSAGYAYRAAGDPLNTFRAPRVMKVGEDAYFKAAPDGINRWGDYSHAVVDPADDLTLWTIQEYSQTRSAGPTFHWGTWWAKVGATSNRTPQIVIPGPHILPVGASTSFTVSVSDPNGNSVSLTNTVAPAGGVFTAGNFSWTSTPSFEGSSNLVVFEANDGQGVYDSLATNSSCIIVPFDSDGDFVGDGWEFQNFGTLTNPATADPDGDGADNYTEYVSGTQPTNANSGFGVAVFVALAPTGRLITAATEPQRRYAIEYSDTAPSDSAAWSTFANLANGIGTWFETGIVSTTYAFYDDEGTNTTGGAPGTGHRAYRVKTYETNVNYTAYLREQTNGIAVDGVVTPAEYGTANALYKQGTNAGFGAFNRIGDFFAAYCSNTLFIGLQGATLEDNTNNGIVVFIDSPRLFNGWQNPALGADQGEIGDTGTPPQAESLLTRANVTFTNLWILPGDDFADLGFGIVDLAVVESQAVSGVRDNMGLYSFNPPQHGNNLGYVASTAVWKDTFSTNGGLEFSVSFASLGGVTTGDVVKVVAFLTSKSGFTSDVTLPANLLGSGSPGFATVTFSNTVMSLQIGGSQPP